MKILSLVIMLVVSVYAKALFSNSQQADASKYMGALKDLIVATQKTRGVTVGYANGNTSALLLIYEYRSDMKKAIGTMESLPLASDPVINNRATTLSLALTRLNSIAIKLSSDEIFNQYTENLANLLMLAQTVSKKGYEDLNEFGKLASTLMMESILPLTENLGQLRALGTGAAASGKTSVEQVYQMKALIKEIKKLHAKFQADQNYILSQNGMHYTTDVAMKMKQIQKEINSFIATTEKNILKKEVHASASKYFSLATDVISDVVVMFEINNRAIVSDSKGWL